MLNKNIHLLNDGRNTYVSMSYSTSSPIDLSFCSADLGLLFSWNVDEDLHDSDHYPIMIKSLQREEENVYQDSSKWHFDRANWVDFSQQLTSKHENMVIDPDINLAVEEFTQDIISACVNNIPRF